MQTDDSLEPGTLIQNTYRIERRLGTGGMVVMIYAIFPDIPDVDELQSGERREGIYGALISLSR